MRYIRVQEKSLVIKHVADTLSSHLISGKKVAWFLSGGSAIELEVGIASSLQTYDMSRLYIGLIDERYGPPGHKNENYTQLLQAGFSLPVQRVLSGKNPEQTAAEFGVGAAQALDEADFSLGIFGIGTDGHTAGIKPHSPAVATTGPATFYEWEDHRRITITPPTIRRLDEAVIYAFGNEKTPTLRALLYENPAQEEQPAQVLKDVKTTTLFTNSILDGAQ